MENLRKLKFRAWDNDRKFMLDVDEIDFRLEKVDGYINRVLMQFTGLLDCKGNPIYEEDIVMNIRTDIKYKVLFSDKTASFKIENKQEIASLCGYSTLEIIGNIHQHPELLERQE